jgi:hypothetical protein
MTTRSKSQRIGDEPSNLENGSEAAEVIARES